MNLLRFWPKGLLGFQKTIYTYIRIDPSCASYFRYTWMFVVSQRLSDKANWKATRMKWIRIFLWLKDPVVGNSLVGLPTLRTKHHYIDIGIANGKHIPSIYLRQYHKFYLIRRWDRLFKILFESFSFLFYCFKDG